jgi:hypothetical protein
MSFEEIVARYNTRKDNMSFEEIVARYNRERGAGSAALDFEEIVARYNRERGAGSAALGLNSQEAEVLRGFYDLGRAAERRDRMAFEAWLLDNTAVAHVQFENDVAALYKKWLNERTK